MKTENKILMKQARASLAHKWGLVVGTYALYLLISILVRTVKGVGPIVSILISGPMVYGLTIFSLAISRNQTAKLEQIFEGFRCFGRSLAAYLLMGLFTILWMLLFIIPGIIAGLSYSQTFFILIDDPTIGVMDAIKKSKKMMYGYKSKLFCLQLRFIGWALLCFLTLGIGFLWLLPYVQISMTKFYEDVKGDGNIAVPTA